MREEKNRHWEKIAFPLVIILSSLLIFAVSLRDFLLFHQIEEAFTVIISFSIFIIAWSSRKYIDNAFLFIIGVAYLCIGSLDFIHMLTFDGRDTSIRYDANIAAQFWLAARYAESLSLIGALFFLTGDNRKNVDFVIKNSYKILIIYIWVLLSVFLSIVYFKIFPLAFIEGQGTTAFRVYSEYIISALFFVFIIGLFRKKREFDPEMFNYLSLALIVKMLAEITFTQYLRVLEFSYVFGHILRFISFLLLYKAVFEVGLNKPYEFMFLNLKKSEERYKSLVESSPDSILVHTREGLVYANGLARKMFGLEDKDLGDMKVTDLFLSQYKERIDGRREKIFRGEWKEAPSMEMEVRDFQGNIIPVEVKGIHLIYEGKSAILSTIRNISKRREAEKKLAEAQEELQKRTKSQLIESYQHMGKINRKISLLLELEENFRSKKKMQEMIDYALASSLGISQANVGLLYIYSENQGYELKASSGVEGEKLSKLRAIPVENIGFIKKLIEENRRVNNPCDIDKSSCFSEIFDLNYFVALPISRRDRCLGFLFLGFADRKGLDTDELEFLDVFVRQISSAFSDFKVMKKD